MINQTPSFLITTRCCLELASARASSSSREQQHEVTKGDPIVKGLLLSDIVKEDENSDLESGKECKETTDSDLETCKPLGDATKKENSDLESGKDYQETTTDIELETSKMSLGDTDFDEKNSALESGNDCPETGRKLFDNIDEVYNSSRYMESVDSDVRYFKDCRGIGSEEIVEDNIKNINPCDKDGSVGDGDGGSGGGECESADYLAEEVREKLTVSESDPGSERSDKDTNAGTGED